MEIHDHHRETLEKEFKEWIGSGGATLESGNKHCTNIFLNIGK